MIRSDKNKKETTMNYEKTIKNALKKLNTKQPINCLNKFKSNNFLGLIIFINILIGKLI